MKPDAQFIVIDRKAFVCNIQRGANLCMQSIPFKQQTTA
jgi:hypothetical protein